MHTRQAKCAGSSLRIWQFNVEGISKSKSELLAVKLKEYDIQVALIQETHTADDSQLSSRGQINGFDIVAYVNHRSYGIATYVRSDILNTETISATINENDVHLVVVKVCSMHITNVYKPPNKSWLRNVIPCYEHPSIYAGDYNSHHSNWGYSSTDKNGDDLNHWSENNNLCLLFDAKDKGTFHSARWQRDYNPDLVFVSMDSELKPLISKRTVLNNFPHSQHRPVMITIGLEFPLINSIQKPRWNFNLANWQSFRDELDQTTRYIKPTVKNYNRFVGAVLAAAKKAIPRGFRREYVPCWNLETERLYKEYCESGDSEVADDLIHSLDNARKVKWLKTVEEMNFTRSSRKAWAVIRRLGAANPKQCGKAPISANKVASRLVQLTKVNMDKKLMSKIRNKLKSKRRKLAHNDEFAIPFTTEEIVKAISHVKVGKAAGLDYMHPEFILNSGPKAIEWLTRFFNDILRVKNVPPAFKKSKIIAILKPGKTPEMPENYRPISLLSVTYKLLERAIYNRISPKIFENIQVEQAGFRPNRSTTDQVLALTTFIEAGFQRNLKTGLALIDLSSAYDTVWRHGMLYKFISIIPSMTLYRLLNNMLCNRHFFVYLGNDVSRQRSLNDGLQQGAVLSCLLFLLYVGDVPELQSRKYIFADDFALADQAKTFMELEFALSYDLDTMRRFFEKWRLRPNPSKTIVSSFHLCNAQANRKLRVLFDGEELKHDFFPKYLGMTLDRPLTYKENSSQTALKMQPRINLLKKLAGTSWGADASVLRTSALALVYSVAEYGAAVWLKSAHTNIIDVALNEALRVITGTVSSTPIEWLQVLANIEPPAIRRYKAFAREWNKIESTRDLPIHNDLIDLPDRRLNSRHPSWVTIDDITMPYQTDREWKNVWHQINVQNKELTADPTVKQAGLDIPRKAWSRLNRIRTGHGNCASCLFKWNLVDSASCDCGEPNQTMKHIANECPNRKFVGGMEGLHRLDEGAVEWLTDLDLMI